MILSAYPMKPESGNMVDKISQEMVQNLADGQERNDTAQEILNRLSQEYGQPLEIALKDDQGVVFKVVDQGNGQSLNTLSPDDGELLKTRLMDITKAVVSDNLL